MVDVTMDSPPANPQKLPDWVRIRAGNAQDSSTPTPQEPKTASHTTRSWLEARNTRDSSFKFPPVRKKKKENWKTFNQHASGKSTTKKWGWRQKVFAATTAPVVFYTAFLVTQFMTGMNTVPDLDQASVKTEISFTDMFDTPLYYAKGVGSKRAAIPLKAAEVPKVLKQAVIAMEDERFYEHSGIDLRSIARAAISTAGGKTQGGSTIDQQVVKNATGDNARGISHVLPRKAREMGRALELSDQYTKDEILTWYINNVYVSGSNIYGYRAAAKEYFGLQYIDEMTLGQAAMLSAIAKGAGKYEKDHERWKLRATDVLDNMVRVGYISQEAADAEKEKLPTPLNIRGKASTYDHVTGMVREILKRQYKDLDGREKVIALTLDPTAQNAAQKAVSGLTWDGDNQAPGKIHQAAMVILTPDNRIQALVGGDLDPDGGNYNRATLKRQVGSVAKVLLMITATKLGIDLHEKNYIDKPAKDGEFPKNYKPGNYGKKYTHKSMSLAQALKKSKNVIMVRLMKEIVEEYNGFEVLKDLATTFGIDTSEWSEDSYSIALGSFEASPLQIAGMMSVFNNDGYYSPPRIIQSIEYKDSNGELINYPLKETPPIRVLYDDELSALIPIFESVTEKEGTGGRARLQEHDTIGKTGTNGKKDAWFVGATPLYTAAVRAGNDDNSDMQEVTGGNQPAKAFHQAMTTLHMELSPSTFHINDMAQVSFAPRRKDTQPKKNRLERYTTPSFNSAAPPASVKPPMNYDSEKQRPQGNHPDYDPY